ncbi:MAG TPA: GNAT family N-acetyltransferase [Candidatus Babeliales bacterium]|nr:GNAT family N-acetyltransferase [Candidatus Babeliales bacterium]
MKQRNKRILFALLATIAIAGAAGWFFFVRQAGPQILEFDIARDGKGIMAIFDRDWDWLIPGSRDTFSPELMMAYRAPQQNPLYAGRLKIKVMRDGDALIGFVAWYMKSPEVGFLNFLDINPEYRGKGYAEKLLRYGMDQMFKAGAKKLEMVTWPHNVRSRALYDRVGWKVKRIDGQVHYEYYP